MGDWVEGGGRIEKGGWYSLKVEKLKKWGEMLTNFFVVVCVCFLLFFFLFLLPFFFYSFKKKSTSLPPYFVS